MKSLLAVLLLPFIMSAAFADDAGLRELARAFSSLETRARLAQAEALGRQMRTAPQSCAEALAAKPGRRDPRWDQAELLLNEMVLAVMTANGVAPAKPCPAMINESAEFNAFATSDQTIIVNTALLERAQDDSELGFVLAHEIAHLRLRHAYYSGIEFRMMERARWYYYWHGERVFSRQMTETRVMETEADRLGLLYACKAGYDLAGVRELFDDAFRYHPPNPRHPAPQSRFADLQKFYGPAAALPRAAAPVRHLDEIKKLIK